MALNQLIGLDELHCYDVVTIALVMFAIDVAMVLWNRQGTQLSPAEQRLLKQYNEQVRIVNRLNSVETFVEQSKAIRKMNAIKKEMQELAVMRMQAAAPTVWQKRIDQFRTPVTMVVLAALYWHEPLVVIHQGSMLPIERLLAFPSFPLGAISAVGWAAICRRVGAKILS